MVIIKADMLRWLRRRAALKKEQISPIHLLVRCRNKDEDRRSEKPHLIIPLGIAVPPPTHLTVYL